MLQFSINHRDSSLMCDVTRLWPRSFPCQLDVLHYFQASSAVSQSIPVLFHILPDSYELRLRL